MAHKSFFKSIGDFFKHIIGSGSHSALEVVEKVYHDLDEDIQVAMKTSSGYVAIINENIDKTPDEVFALIQQKYPDVTKDSVKEFINGILTKMKLYGAGVPATFEDALQALTVWLKGFEGNTWVTLVRAIVAIGTEFLQPVPMIQKVEFVLEYVYREMVLPHIHVLPDPAGVIGGA